MMQQPRQGRGEGKAFERVAVGMEAECPRKCYVNSFAPVAVESFGKCFDAVGLGI